MTNTLSSLKSLSVGTLLAGLISVSVNAGGGSDDHHDEGHAYPAHVVGAFLGATDTDGSDFTFGVEYEYRFSKMFGVGVVAEHTPAAHHDDGITVGLAALHFHPAGGLRLTGGIGKEWVGGDHSHSTTLYRLGAAYDFELGKFAVAPTVNVDFVDGHEAVVYGLVISRHF